MRDIIVLLMTLTLFLANCSPSREAVKPSSSVPHKTRLVAAPSRVTLASASSADFR